MDYCSWADEPHRVAKITDRHREYVVTPLAKSGVTLDMVNNFWNTQSFDLGLPKTGNTYGNCVGCFLKSRTTLNQVAMEHPEYLDWWVQQETKMQAKFRKDFPLYSEIKVPLTLNGISLNDTLPCHCTD